LDLAVGVARLHVGEVCGLAVDLYRHLNSARNATERTILSQSVDDRRESMPWDQPSPDPDANSRDSFAPVIAQARRRSFGD
jgi:hypothetical protein